MPTFSTCNDLLTNVLPKLPHYNGIEALLHSRPCHLRLSEVSFTIWDFLERQTLVRALNVLCHSKRQATARISAQ